MLPELPRDEALTAGGPDASVAIRFVTVQSGPFVPLPNSVVTYTQQTAILSDDDLLLFEGVAEFTDPAVYLGQLVDLVELAGSLSLLREAPVPSGQIPDADAAIELFAYLNTVEVPTVEGAEVTLLRGEAAEGIVVNGASAGEMPVFTEMLPARLAASHGDSAEDEAEEEPDPLQGVRAPDPSPFSVEPGHLVVAGSNLAVNEARITTNWVDAPVIAVAGDMIRMDAISQVNVLVDRDASVIDTGEPASVALNAAAISRAVAPGTDTAADDGGLPETWPEAWPETWNVTHITGDLVVVNWVKQFIFATDTDRAEIAISGAATHIGLGENMIVNSTTILELGFHYDLILVGGSLITLNIVDQVNVLLDSDTITGSAAGAVVATRENLQMNEAEIRAESADVVVEMKAAFREALDDMATGARELSAQVAQDAAFAAKETLQVLRIEGNLTKMNVIEQKNFLGDADQVHLLLDDFRAMSEAPVEVMTGANAQLNSAKIVDVGIDSDVMVAGSVYSDALIYQAQLIDTDAAPTGVGLAALANEAIAFLADGMIGPDPEDEIGADHLAQDHPGSVDVMQSVLA